MPLARKEHRRRRRPRNRPFPSRSPCPTSWPSARPMKRSFRITTGARQGPGRPVHGGCGGHPSRRHSVPRPPFDRTAARRDVCRQPRREIPDHAESIQFLSPEVVKEEGPTKVRPAKGTSETRRHTALLVKSGRSLVDLEHPRGSRTLVPPHERLKDLAWMIGEWVDEGPDAHVRIACRWSEDGNFLIRTFAVRWGASRPCRFISGSAGTRWAKQFRSWEFDSEGGYGEGRWSRDGDRWVIKHTGVRPEGITASATHIMTRERADLVRGARPTGSSAAATYLTEQTFIMVRLPPAPQSAAMTPAGRPRRTPKRSGDQDEPQPPIRGACPRT